MSGPACVFHVIEAPGHGGTEVYVEALARHLAPEIPQVIVPLSGTAEAARARFAGLETHAPGGLGGFARLLRGLPEGALVQFHLYSRLLPAIAALRLRRPGGVRSLVTLHQPLANWSWRHRLGWRLALRMADGVVCVSGAVLDEVAAIIDPARPAEVISAPLPAALLREDLPAGPGTAARFRVVGAGRLAPEKHWHTLVAAMRDVPGAELLIAGEGPRRAALSERARAAGVALSLPGRMQRAELFALFRGADVFVLPSRFEGLGLAAIEAMALGLPVVTADYPAAADYILPGRTGFSFPAGDAEALARILTRLRDDPALRHRIAQAGAAHVRARYTTAAQFARYPALYARIAACAS